MYKGVVGRKSEELRLIVGLIRKYFLEIIDFALAAEFPSADDWVYRLFVGFRYCCMA
jgi:hypothetical protein